MKKFLAVVVGIAIVGAAGVAISQQYTVKTFKADMFRSDAIKFDMSKAGVWYFTPAEYGNIGFAKFSNNATSPTFFTINVWAYDSNAGMWYYGYAKFSNSDAFFKWIDYFDNATSFTNFSKYSWIWWGWSTKNAAFEYSNEPIKNTPSFWAKPVANGYYEFLF